MRNSNSISTLRKRPLTRQGVAALHLQCEWHCGIRFAHSSMSRQLRFIRLGEQLRKFLRRVFRPPQLFANDDIIRMN